MLVRCASRCLARAPPTPALPARPRRPRPLRTDWASMQLDPRGCFPAGHGNLGLITPERQAPSLPQGQLATTVSGAGTSTTWLVPLRCSRPRPPLAAGGAQALPRGQRSLACHVRQAR